MATKKLQVAGLKGQDGVGISSIEQTTTSSASGGENIITATLNDGNKSTFKVMNGKDGAPGPAGSDANVTTENIKKALGYTPANKETINEAVNEYLEANPIEVGDAEKVLYEKSLLSYNGTEYDKFPIELEHYSWNHFVGTKRLAKAVENASLFTTEGATAHEANAVGFNDGSWYLFQWVQNTAGNTVDMEDASGSCEIQGKLMYWRYGVQYNLTGESDTFTISKQGDTITRTVAGDTITASGGVGICNVANKDASTVYSISTYYHNGKHIPTTREIVIDSKDYTTELDGKLTVGDAVMWTLTKGGVKSDFDDSILGTEYGGHVNCQIYCDYASSGYKYYMAVVRPNKGISIITSTDCTNWTWITDVDIPVKNTAYIETALTFLGDRWYIAVRCKDGRLWVAKLMTDYSLNWNFFMPDCGSKPMFITCSNALLLACAPDSRYSCRIYRFTSSTKDLAKTKYPTKLEAIADITYNACNYPFFVSGREGRPGQTSYSGIPKMICLGTNNYVTNKQGCSYFLMDLPVYSAMQYPNEAVNEMAKDADFGTLTFTGAVEASYDGSGDVTVNIPVGGSSGGTTWEQVANETLASEATGFTEIKFTTPRKINRIRCYMEIIGTATNGESEYNMQIVVNGTVIGSSQGSAVTKTAGTKKCVFFDVDISASGSFSKGFLQTANGDTWSSQACNQFNETIKSTTEVNSITARSRNAWGTLGVGSRLVLDIC